MFKLFKKQAKEISEIDAKIYVLRQETLALFIIMLGFISFLLARDIGNNFDSSVFVIIGFICFTLSLIILIISFICKKDYMKFINVMSWPTKYILKNKE